jgi:hypothetical protein
MNTIKIESENYEYIHCSNQTNKFEHIEVSPILMKIKVLPKKSSRKMKITINVKEMQYNKYC